MKITIWFIFLSVWLCCSKVSAQDSEKVKLKVRITNSLNGTEIKNAQIKVSYVNNGTQVLPKTEKKNTFYEISENRDILVSVEAPAFYPQEERFKVENYIDFDVLEIKLNARPNGNATVVVTDKVTQEPVQANVEISFGGGKNKQKTNSKGELDFFFEINGNSTLIVSADGYKTKEIIQTLNLNELNKQIKVELEKETITQIVAFKDKSTNQAIINPEVHLYLANDASKANIWNQTKNDFQAFPGQIYKIKVLKEGYKTVESEIKPANALLNISLEPIALSSFIVKIKEEGIPSKLPYILSVTSPSGTKESQKLNTPFTPKEKGEYLFVLSQEGSGSYSQKVQSKYSDEQKETIITFEVKTPEPKTKTLNIVALDSLTNQPITQAKIKVFNDKAKEVQGKIDKNTLEVKLLADGTYFYEVSAKDYENRTSNIDLNNNVVLVYLSKKQIVTNFAEYEYTLIDSKTKQPIPNAKLQILDINDNNVEVLYNSSKNSFLTYKINPGKGYYLHAKAEGYKDLNGPVLNAVRNIKLEMEAIEESKNIVISVQDGYTKTFLSPKNLIITDNKKKETIGTKADSDKFRSEFSANNSYTIAFEIDGYKPFSKTYSTKDLTDNKIEIIITKDNYPLELVISNDLTEAQKNEAKGTFSYLYAKDNLKSSFEKSSKTFYLDTDPNQNLQISIKVPGFKLYYASNNRKLLNLSSIDVLLEPEPEKPVVEAPKAEPDPVITQAEVPVIKPETPIVQIEKSVETPEVLEPKKGKRFPLDGVNFEQSKTTMLYGSELKLNEVLKFLQENPTLKIEVIGHTDKIGDERQNQRLSEFRARVVANWLFNKGIATNRIITTGKGSSEPIAANDSEETKAQNRRIEILVLED